MKDSVHESEIDISLQSDRTSWKILLVDGDLNHHDFIKASLENFIFAGRTISFLSAYSGLQARESIANNPDTALIFLTAVLETPDAGYKVAEYIRQELPNYLVRIVLITPGEDTPIETLILNYDLDDYQPRSELQSQRLRSTTLVALRNYLNLQSLKISQQQLEIWQNQERPTPAHQQEKKTNSRISRTFTYCY